MNYDAWKTHNPKLEGPHPLDDKQLVADFCQDRNDDFDYWFNEHANHPAKKEHYELAYCESHISEFLKYADKHGGYV